MLKIGRITMGVCQTNCYFLYEEGKNKVIFIDPADQGETIYNQITEAGFEVAAILLTHAHFDHIWGCNELRHKTGVKVYAYEAERELCESSLKNCSEMAGRAYTVMVDEYLKDNQAVTIEGMTFQVIATPGHTIGSCCYYFENDKILISGDTLFAESIGRSDLPTGSSSTLVRSFSERLLILPEDVQVYPGHGPDTTIGHEIKYNPFYQK